MTKKKKYYYHKIKSLGNTYYDSDRIMIHGMFQCLVTFVETIDTDDYYLGPDEQYKEEIEEGHIELEEINFLRGIYKEIMELYNWWIKFQKVEEKIDSFLGAPSSYKWSSLGDKKRSTVLTRKWAAKSLDYNLKLEDKETEMAIRLIKIRKYLWS